MRAYLPLLGFALFIAATLLATAADRRRQLATIARKFDFGATNHRKRTRRAATIQRVVLWLIALTLALYVWTYQR
ncbi:MAG: hypothetical protein ACR2P7_04520, partial [bacterium]